MMPLKHMRNREDFFKALLHYTVVEYDNTSDVDNYILWGIGSELINVTNDKHTSDYHHHANLELTDSGKAYVAFLTL